MPKTVEIEGVGTVDFPDDMALDQIDQTIRTQVLPQFQKRKARLSQLTAERAAFENEQSSRPTTFDDVLGGVAIATFAQAPAEMRRQANSVAEAVINPFSPEIGRVYGERAQTARRDVERAAEEAATIDPSTGGALARTVFSTAASSLPLVGASLVAPALAPAAWATRAAVGAGAAAGALQSGGSVFNDAKNAYMQQGDTEEAAVAKAYQPALISGAITGALTGAFGATGIQAIAKGLTKDAAKGVVRRVLREAGFEATEEGVDQVGQGIVERATFNEKKTLEEIVNEAVLAGVAGGFLGGGVNLAADVAGRVSRAGEGAVSAARQALADRAELRAANEPEAMLQRAILNAGQKSASEGERVGNPVDSGEASFFPETTLPRGRRRPFAPRYDRGEVLQRALDPTTLGGLEQQVEPAAVRDERRRRRLTPIEDGLLNRRSRPAVAPVETPPVVVEPVAAPAPTVKESLTVATPIAPPVETPAVPVAETAAITPTPVATNDLQDTLGIPSPVIQRPTVEQAQPLPQAGGQAAESGRILQSEIQTPPAITTEQPHGFVSLVDFVSSASNPKVGIAFDTELPDVSTPGNLVALENQLLTGARQSSAQGSNRSITHKFLAVMDTADGQVHLLPVYPDTKSGRANTVAPNAAGDARGQRLSSVLAQRSATDIGAPRYEVLEGVRLKNPARTFPRSFTREEWSQIRSDALAEQEAVTTKFVGDLEPAEGLIDTPTAAVQETVIPAGHFSENDLRHLFSLLQRNPTLEGFIQAAGPEVRKLEKRTVWKPGVFAPQIVAAISAQPATFDQFYETFDPSGYAEWKERTIRSNRNRVTDKVAGAAPGGPIPIVPGLPQTFATPAEAVSFLTDPQSPIATDVGNVLVAALTDPALQKSLGALGFKLSIQNAAVKLAESSTTGRAAAYDPVTGTVMLAMGIRDPAAGPHELAHHLETLLPAKDRAALADARQSAITKELRSADLSAGQRAFLEALQAGEKSSAWYDSQFQSNGPAIDEFYPLINTSEFFAQGFSERYLNRIKATQQERGLWDRIKEMLKRVYAWMKDRVGLTSAQDAAFRRLIAGEFEVTARNGMLFDDDGLAGALAYVFKSPNDVAVRTNALDLTPEQVQEMLNLASTQTALVPANFQASVQALNPDTSTPDGVARRELGFIEKLGDIGTVVAPQALAQLPSSTPEENRIREVAAGGLIEHYLTVQQRQREIGVDLDQAEQELTKAISQLPRRNKAESEEAMLAAMSSTLLNDYKRYLADQVALAKPSSTIGGRQNALLEAAQRRVADAEVTPSSLRKAINAISAQIPDAILNAATNPADIAQWADANRPLFSGVVADSVRDFMLDNSTGKTPLAYKGVIEHLKAMRDLRSIQDQTLADVANFQNWFAAGGRPVSVGSDRLAKKYYRWRTQQEKAARIVEAIDKDIAKWDAEVRGLLLAQDKLVELQQSPEWQSGQYLAGKIAQAVPRDVMETDRAAGTTAYIGPETGKRYTVSLLPDSTVESQNMAELISLIDEAKRFVTNPDSDPIVRQYWEARIPYLENYRARPDFNPDQGSTARFWNYGGTRIEINPWNTFRRAIGGLPGTLGSELKTLGGRAGAEALEVVQRADQVEQELETNQNHETHGGKAVNLAVLKAAESHGYQGTTGAVVWERDVANPIMAAGQQSGTPQLKVGDTIPTSGRVVTKADLEAIRVMKEWNNGVMRAAQGAPEGRSLKFYNPVQVVAESGDKGSSVNRNAIGAGPLTMARLPSDWGIKFSNVWRNATAAQKAQLLVDPVNFQMAVLGHIAERSPEFRRGSLDGIYELMARDMRRGQRYANLDEVLDDLANRMVAAQMAPDFATARNQAASTLMGEIDSSVANIARNYIPDSVRANDPNRPEGLIDVVTASNSFTKPRVGLIAPSTYFDYSMAQNERRAEFTSSLRNVMRLREIEKIKDVIAAYEQIRLGFDKQVEALIAGGMNKFEARRKVGNDSRAVLESGKTGIDFYGVEQSLNALNYQMAELDRIATLNNEHFENPVVRTLNGVKSFLGSSLLVPLSSAARNTSGSIFMNAVMNRAIGKSLPHLAGSSARFAAYTANNLAKQLAYVATRNPKLARVISRNATAVRGITGAVARWINDWQQVQTELDRIGVSPNTQIGQAFALRQALPESGGRITSRDQGIVADVATGAANLPGVRQGVAPIYRGATEFIKATFPGFFDRAINAAALDYWGGFHDSLKARAWQAWERRESMNGPGWDDLTNGANLLTPKELGAGSFQGAKYLRDKFAPAGLLDRILLDYYKRTKALPRDQRSAVPLLTPEEDAGVFLEFLKSANVGTESNRPTAAKGAGLSGVGRGSLGQFLGMPSEILNEVSALANRSTKDSGNPLKLATTAAVVMLLAIIIGGGGNEAAKELNRLTTGEASSAIGLANIQDPNSAARWAVSAMGTVLPFIGEPLARALGGSNNKPLLDLTQIVPMAGFATDAAMTLQKIGQTRDIVYPVADMVRRWGPATKVRPGLLLIPNALGDQASRNASRAVTAAVPPSMEPRKQSGGGAPTQSPMTPIMRDLVAAAYNGDREKVASLYQAAVDEKRRQGSPDPEGSVLSSIQSQVPTRKVLGRVPTATEEATILSRMSGTQRADFDKSRRAFALLESVAGKNIAFVKRTGPKATRARSRGLLGGSRSILGRRRRQSFPRLRLGSGRSGRTVGTSRRKRRALV